ncbi:MAG: NYN domain-containing protein, partial [Actinomycetota bacterium]
YISALRTVPNISLHFGTYLTSKTRMPLVTPPPNTVEVWKTEEKGSDVNLATYLLLDAFDDKFEAAVVISNDSDLAEPIRVVRRHFRKPVVVLHPCRAPRTPSVELKMAGTKSMIIQPASLATSQIASTLTDNDGNTIARPTSW